MTSTWKFFPEYMEHSKPALKLAQLTLAGSYGALMWNDGKYFHKSMSSFLEMAIMVLMDSGSRMRRVKAPT